MAVYINDTVNENTDCETPIPKVCGRQKVHMPTASCDTIHFTGVDDAEINQGQDFDPTEGVHAYDGNGEEIPFTVEPSEVDECQVGEIELEYTATGVGKKLLPKLCGSPNLKLPYCGVERKRLKRNLVIKGIAPPSIRGIERVCLDRETLFNPMDGVSAVDGNGNTLEVSHSGTYDEVASGEIASFESIGGNSKSLKVELNPIQNCTPWMGTEKNTTPYIMRSVDSIGQDVGNTQYDTLVGGSVGWNQQIKESENYISTGGTVSTVDGIGKFTANAAGQQIYKAMQVVAGHKYLASATFKTTTATQSIVLRAFSWDFYGDATTSWQTVSSIGMYTASGGASVGVKDNRTSGWDEIQVRALQAIDLTALFGTTIADYIYNLEQTTAGAGVAWFRKLFPNEYYPYDPGSLKSVQTSGHKVVGFNQLNPSNYYIGSGSNYNEPIGNTLKKGGSSVTVSGANPIVVAIRSSWVGAWFKSEPLVRGQSYELCHTISAETIANLRTSLYFIDDDDKIVSLIQSGNGYKIPDQKVTPNKSGLRLALVIESTTAQTITINDICLHLVGDGSRDGTYEPYQSITYPLDSSLTLRGIPKLNNGQLYYDGDVYKSDGVVTRKYGIVDLGTLNWGYDQNNNQYVVQFTQAKGASSPSVIGNIICSKYVTTPYDYSSSANYDKTISIYTTSYLAIRDSAHTGDNYVSPTEFKNSLSGVYLVYEKATPTTETAEPFTSPQAIYDGGTEEYIGAEIPVGHETTYGLVCPISGWTDIDTHRTGENVWDEEWEVGDLSSVDGSPISATDRIRAKNYTSVKPSTTYYIKCGTVSARIIEYDADKVMVKYNDGMHDTAFTTTANTHYIRFYMFPAYGTTYNNDISINYPSTDTDYHPYNGDTYHTELGQTVYGGTLDIVSGELVVDRANIASYNGETLPSTWISDRDEYASGTTPTTGAQVVYELATPLTIQLTPQEVELLLGTNNVWSDGEVTVAYPVNIPDGAYNYPFDGAYEITYHAEDRCGNETTEVRQVIVSKSNSVCGARVCCATVAC